MPKRRAFSPSAAALSSFLPTLLHRQNMERLTAAEDRMSRLSTAIADAESAITAKEADLHQRAAHAEANLVAEVKRAVAEQRVQQRHAVRGLLTSLAEEEERRAAMEGAFELCAKEAEYAWRAEHAGFHTVGAGHTRPI